ncbi:MAG TPA: hypothetical protein VMS86_03375 [Thermoanaerobaculia bacterium]|nr:hypothetical protein [Thermoanaerobaculia bacterium]
MEPRAGAAASRQGGEAVGAAGADSARPALAADLAALGRLLEQATAADTLADTDRSALEDAVRGLLQDAAAGACEGCRAVVSYVDQAGGGGYFRCELRPSGGEAVADLHLFHRPRLPVEAAESWGRRRLAGHPASGFGGDHLFVWPGRFEIRAFARDDRLRGAERLEGLLESLPLDALARL